MRSRESGVKVQMKSSAQFEVPEEFLKRLDDDRRLSEAFQALTPEDRKGICCISPEQSDRRLVPRA